MALTKTVTRLRPVRGARGVFTVGFHLVLNNGTKDVFDGNITETYVKDKPIAPVKVSLLKKGNRVIKKCEAEESLDGKQAYKDAITEINSELVITQ